MVIFWWFYVTSQQETMGSNLLVSWGISAWTVSGVQTHVSWSLCLPGWLEQARGICCCFFSLSLSLFCLARLGGAHCWLHSWLIIGLLFLPLPATM